MSSWFDQRRFFSEHLRHGIKTGLAAVLAYSIVTVFDLAYGFWGVLSAVIVMQINVADSLQMCWNRLTGTAIGAAIGLLTLLALPGPGWPTALGLLLSVGFCAYMTRYNPRYLMAAITVVIIVVAGSEEERKILFGIYRILEIGIGVGSAFLVTVLIWPHRAGSTLREQLRDNFAEASRCATILVEAFLSKQTSVSPDLLHDVSARTRQARDLLSKALGHERLVSSEDLDALSRRVTALENCVEQMRAMLHVLNDFDEGEGYEIIMSAQVRELAQAVSEVMVSIGEGRDAALDELEKAVAAFESRLEELRAAGVTRRFNLHKLLQVFSFLHAMESMAKGLLKTRSNLAV
ncbi:MAG: FUSC family protein [Desulfovibrionales bacterium]|nr:MAG: FUSC family protein [Desulfovibrionales bacterium]